MCIIHRENLQSQDFLDRSLCIVKEPTGTVLVPVLHSCLLHLERAFLKDVTVVWCKVINTHFIKAIQLKYSSNLTFHRPQPSMLSKKGRDRRRGDKLEDVLQELLESHGESWTKEVKNDLPRSFQRHGDLVLLGQNCFSLPLWKKMGNVCIYI